MEKLCDCEYLDLEKGDTLYYATSDDCAINYNFINNIKYCPCCGKELPTLQERMNWRAIIDK